MRGCQCGCEGEGLFGLAEEDAEGGGFAGEGGGERGGIGDLGDIGAAGLLGAFEGDAAPAFGALGGGEGEVLLGAAGKDGRDSGDAQFGGFLDGPLEAIELEDGEEKVDGEGRVGFQLFVEGEEDFRLLVIAGGGAEFGDFGAMEEAVGYDVEELAGLCAEDAGEVDGLLAGEGGLGGMAGLRRPGVGDEAASHRAGNREQGTGNSKQRQVHCEEPGTWFTEQQREGKGSGFRGALWALAFCSLFPVPWLLAFCSLFTVPCSLVIGILFPIYCSLFPDLWGGGR